MTPQNSILFPTLVASATSGCWCLLHSKIFQASSSHNQGCRIANWDAISPTALVLLASLETAFAKREICKSLQHISDLIRMWRLG